MANMKPKKDESRLVDLYNDGTEKYELAPDQHFKIGFVDILQR